MPVHTRKFVISYMYMYTCADVCMTVCGHVHVCLDMCVCRGGWSHTCTLHIFEAFRMSPQATIQKD